MSGGAASRGAQEFTTHGGTAARTTSANGDPVAPLPSRTEQSTGTPLGGADAPSAAPHTVSTGGHSGLEIRIGTDLLLEMGRQGMSLLVAPEHVRIIRPGDPE